MVENIITFSNFVFQSFSKSSLHVLQEYSWFVNYFASFYPAEEETERKAVIESTSLGASQYTIETNNVDFQPM